MQSGAARPQTRVYRSGLMTSTKAARTGIDLTGFTPIHDGILIPPGGRPKIASSFGQQAMQSSLIPRIYERYWRPLTFGVIAAGKLGRIDPRGAAASLELSDDAQVLDVACGPGNTTRPCWRTSVRTPR